MPTRFADIVVVYYIRIDIPSRHPRKDLLRNARWEVVWYDNSLEREPARAWYSHVHYGCFVQYSRDHEI
jgi:hypothetical protein